VRRIGGKGRFDFTLHLENEKLKKEIKNIIYHETEILKMILDVEILQGNTQIIIRFIGDDVQYYKKQLYEGFNYELIFDKLMSEYISKEYIVMDVIIQLVE